MDYPEIIGEFSKSSIIIVRGGMFRSCGHHFFVMSGRTVLACPGILGLFPKSSIIIVREGCACRWYIPLFIFRKGGYEHEQ